MHDQFKCNLRFKMQQLKLVGYTHVPESQPSLTACKTPSTIIRRTLKRPAAKPKASSDDANARSEPSVPRPALSTIHSSLVACCSAQLNLGMKSGSAGACCCKPRTDPMRNPSSPSGSSRQIRNAPLGSRLCVWDGESPLSGCTGCACACVNVC